VRIHQMGSVLAAGDAVTNHIIEIDRRLRAWGFLTAIYGADIAAAPTAAAQADTDYTPFLEAADDLLIYHYSAYCENQALFRRSRNRKVLVYHNITPSDYFHPYDLVYEALCRRGREQLGELVACELAVGVSEYNRRELLSAGFLAERTAVLPLFLSVEDFQRTPRDEAYYWKLKTGGVTNILFVGKVAPNKAFEDLLKIFAAYHRHVNPVSRLILAGARFLPGYDRLLNALAVRLGVSDAVVFTDRLRLRELRACYEAADLFLCASRHEGFCAPLLEAMYFRVPILARAEAAVPETLGAAGVLFHCLDYPTLAELMETLTHDRDVRERIILAQEARLADFAPARVAAQLHAVLETVGVTAPADAKG
jgi:glycosyltransferase involved in cell wall biosynthesis